MNYRLKRWFRYIFCLVIVLALCWQSSSSSESLNNLALKAVKDSSSIFGHEIQNENLYFIIRRIGHFTAFLLLALTGHLAIAGDADNFKSTMVCSITMNIGLAFLAETFQTYISERHATIQDFLINASGATSGIIIAVLIELIQKSRRRAEHLH